MRTDPDWLKKLIRSLEKEKKTNQETLNICREALEKSLEPHLVWLENKEKAENACM